MMISYVDILLSEFCLIKIFGIELKKMAFMDFVLRKSSEFVKKKKFCNKNPSMFSFPSRSLLLFTCDWNFSFLKVTFSIKNLKKYNCFYFKTMFFCYLFILYSTICI